MLETANPVRSGNSIHHSEGPMTVAGRPGARRFRVWRGSLALLAFAVACAFTQTFAQSRKSKVPVIRRLSGSQRLAFSGVVRSLDLKMKVLNVDRGEGKDVEIFPVKKGIHVEDASGKRLRLSALRPGTNILIYYTERAGERKVTQVMVLGMEKSESKKSSHPST
jgi:hypothetical protein